MSLPNSPFLDQPARSEQQVRDLLIADCRKRYILGEINDTKAVDFLTQKAGLTRHTAIDLTLDWDEIMVDARAYERRSIESSADFLSPADRQRLDELWQGARPRIQYIDAILTERVAKQAAKEAEQPDFLKIAAANARSEFGR